MESTAPKYFCFVLMPFLEEFNDVYQLGIKASCDDAGAYCERVDEQIFQESILDRIYNQIAKADLVIADMTGRNPNVFYEVGYAHALNKPTILLTKHADDIPFDLKHFPHIVYEGKITTLKEQLTKRIFWFKENTNASAISTRLPIDIYIGDKNLALGNIVHEFPNFNVIQIQFLLHNISLRVLRTGEYQIGVISELETYAGDSIGIVSNKLPNGKFLHMYPFFEQLFPGGFISFQLDLEDYEQKVNQSEITIRLYHENGYEDYILGLCRKK